MKPLLKNLYIMRGVSGSGKNWWIDRNLVHPVVLSTDDHHLEDRPDGTKAYVFKKDRLGEFRNQTLLDCVTALRHGQPLLVINNTNLRLYEIAPYYRLGEAFGYKVEIIWVIAPPDLCIKRAQHGMPPDLIRQSFNSIEAVPFWWNQRVVLNGEQQQENADDQ